MHQSWKFCLEILKPPKIYSLYAPPIRSLSSFSNTVPSSLDHRKVGVLQVVRDRSPFLIRRMSDSTCPLSVEKEIFIDGGGAQQIQFLTGVNDNYDGVTVNLEDPMDAEDFAVKLKASLLKWKQEGKKGIWIKIPISLANLVEAAVKEGFRYHHAEPEYLMLVTWISERPDTIPANASHRVGIGAFVLNPNGEVLVVQETGGAFRGTNVWKLPTGVVNQGEDICEAAVREVKEETGIDTKFVEVLAFRQSHNSFFGKSDLFFLCVLRACSYEIDKQDSEILAAQLTRGEARARPAETWIVVRC
ncbi:PREDICTED: nudix hydrolase 7 isoform X2 [Tarenaya hassleriana]|uniref:nudix hydrolase 7 isoform X2 n=1 Tax=Tarenaya hassleriana TaxID=28532 RepID=UPI00053C21BE|nr:PREDICTED: nudix hydrolase 7 isoform X2 [Tarenaya hassleriana]